MSKVFVGCKLPHGLTIDHPGQPGVTVTLKGANKVEIVGQRFGVTMVDAEFWEAWVMFNANYPALKSGSIWAAKTESDCRAAGLERATLITGFERSDPKKSGVVPDGDKQLKPEIPVLDMA